MITKAFVEGVVKPNKYVVRIPLFHGVKGSANYVDSAALPTATLCSLPNVSNVVGVGDVVYVSFEDNDESKPIILGHLYTGSANSDTNIDLMVRTLSVADSVDDVTSTNLTKNTIIGDISYSLLKELIFWWRNNDFSGSVPTTTQVISNVCNDKSIDDSER